MASDAPSGEMTFDQLVTLLDSWVGRGVEVSLRGPEESSGSTSLSTSGPLAAAAQADEVQLIDPRPGRVAAFRINTAALVLHEGDFVDAGVTDFGGVTTVSADFDEVTLLVSIRKA